MEIKVYSTRTEYEAEVSPAAVSVILSENTVYYAGVNVVHTRPAVGDFYIYLAGRKYFISPQSATAALLDSLPVVGKVYHVQGRKFYFFSGISDHSEQWSNVCDYHIVPDASLFDGGNYKLTVTLQGVENPEFFIYTYDEVGTGTDEEKLYHFIDALNRWLMTNAPKWEAYVNDDDWGILQLSTYDSYESTCSITSCTLTKLVGSELAAETISDARNENGQDFNYYQVMCYNRALSYFATNGSTPTTAPTNIVADQAPVTKTFFEDNPLGVNLRNLFSTYKNYIEKCMVHLRELNRGVMKFRDGKSMTAKLMTKTVIRRGVEECPYRAAVYANSYYPTFEGAAIGEHGPGTWWLPSMYELGLIMRNIKDDQSDPVSYGLNLVTGWSYVSNASNHWSVCRYSGSNAWDYGYHGIVYYRNFCNSFRALAVSASYIDD